MGNMAKKTRKHGALTLPSRNWAMRTGHVLLFALLMAIIVLGKAGNPTVSNVRMGLADTLTPMLETIAAPFDALRNIGTSS